MSEQGITKSEFCLKQGRKISDICLKQGQGMRGRAAPPHPGIYRVPSRAFILIAFNSPFNPCEKIVVDSPQKSIIQCTIVFLACKLIAYQIRFSVQEPTLKENKMFFNMLLIVSFKMIVYFKMTKAFSALRPPASKLREENRFLTRPKDYLVDFLKSYPKFSFF